MDVIWLVVLGAAALLVRVGQTLYYAGLARSKNAAGAAMRSAADVSISVVAFWAVGLAIATTTAGHLFGWGGVPPHGLLLVATVLVGTGVVSGAVAERSKFVAAAAAWAALAGVVTPVAMWWTWHGWLARLGVVDVAGAGAVHLTAGAFALAGAIVVGPRVGKYNRDGSASMIPGHNVPLAVAGAITTVIGFLPCVVGHVMLRAAAESAPQAAFNTLLAGAAGGVFAMTLSQLRYGKPDIGLALAGLLGGVVASTAGAGLVGAPAAFVTGAVAGLLVPAAAIALDLFGRVDDPAGGVAVHGVGGAWGLIAAGLFAPGTFTDQLRHVGVNLLAIVVIIALAGGAGAAIFTLLRSTIDVRSTEADEYDGLDLAEHDIGAYPDFQQTTIKSYHLREA